MELAMWRLDGLRYQSTFNHRYMDKWHSSLTMEEVAGRVWAGQTLTFLLWPACALAVQTRWPWRTRRGGQCPWALRQPPWALCWVHAATSALSAMGENAWFWLAQIPVSPGDWLLLGKGAHTACPSGRFCMLWQWHVHGFQCDYQVVYPKITPLFLSASF